MELAPEYVAVILERWHNATGKTPELIKGDKTESQLPTGQKGNGKRGKR
jgi:DNA modification methylase